VADGFDSDFENKFPDGWCSSRLYYESLLAW
jgi:hypothetical protein